MLLYLQELIKHCHPDILVGFIIIITHHLRPLQDSNVLKNQLFLNFSFSIFRFESLFFHFRLFYLSFFVLESDNSLHSLLFGS